jgi:hypothetical protein
MSTSIRGSNFARPGNAKIRSKGGFPVYECQYTFIVEATTTNESYANVIQTTGLPIVGLDRDPTGYAICTGKVATRRIENTKIWDVVCDFSSEIDDSSGSSGDPTTDPGEWVPIWETKYERYQELVTRDINGDAVANSAGQIFQNGLTITRKIPVWEFFQIESAGISDKQIIDRSDVVNSAAFSRGGETYAAKTLLCNVLSSVVGRYYGELRRLTQYQVKYKSDKWTHKRQDVGYIWKKQGSSQLIDPNEASTIPIALDGAGRPAGGYKLSTNQPTETPDPPEILEFDVYQAVSFSFLR